MITNLKPYSAYKNSGVPWLGQVPEHWEVLPGRAVFREINDRGHPDEQMLSVTIARGVLRQADLLADSSKKDSSNEDKSKYKLVQPGDLVYNKMRAWQGAVGVSAYRGIVSPAYIVQRLRSAENLPRYMHFLLRTPLFASEAERWSYGITSDQWSLRAEEFKGIYFSLPPFPEQTAIVRFLDWADRRIRRVIRARQRRIKLLDEYKQAVIHRAVTGRVDVLTGEPYPAYKDSGVEWLGQVPVHWEVRRLKHICRLVYGDALPDASRKDGSVPVYGSNGRVGFHSVSNAQAPCIVIGRKGSFGKLQYSDVPVFAIDTTFFLDDRFTSAHLRWLFFVLGWLRLDEVCKDAAVPGLDREDAYKRFLPLPPLPDQTAIAKYLDTHTAKIDAATAATHREIDLLREYRERLIADVVTGKVDVREVAAQLPEELNEPELLIDADEGEGEASEMSEINGEVLEDVADE